MNKVSWEWSEPKEFKYINSFGYNTTVGVCVALGIDDYFCFYDEFSDSSVAGSEASLIEEDGYEPEFIEGVMQKINEFKTELKNG